MKFAGYVTTKNVPGYRKTAYIYLNTGSKAVSVLQEIP